MMEQFDSMRVPAHFSILLNFSFLRKKSKVFRKKTIDTYSGGTTEGADARICFKLSFATEPCQSWGAGTLFNFIALLALSRW